GVPAITGLPGTPLSGFAAATIGCGAGLPTSFSGFAGTFAFGVALLPLSLLSGCLSATFFFATGFLGFTLAAGLPAAWREAPACGAFLRIGFPLRPAVALRDASPLAFAPADFFTAGLRDWGLAGDLRAGFAGF